MISKVEEAELIQHMIRMEQKRETSEAMIVIQFQ